RHHVMISTECAAVKTYEPGFNLEDVTADKYGHRLHFWDWQKHELTQSIDLGQDGLIPLEIRFHHHPESAHAFAGAALSSTLWHCHKANGAWQPDKIIAVPSVELAALPLPAPRLDIYLVPMPHHHSSTWRHLLR